MKLTPAQRRALEIVRDNPDITGMALKEHGFSWGFLMKMTQDLLLEPSQQSLGLWYYTITPAGLKALEGKAT